MTQLLELTDAGLYCPPAGIHIDPWRGVERAVVTHAHGDHARWGSHSYLCAARGESILRIRLGDEARIESLGWGESLMINDVKLSFHPAGHILGSAQVRLERAGEVVVVSGDYKTDPDRTCDPFEPIRCDTFVTESTFGLPIYRWLPDSEIFRDLHEWWARNSAEGRTSIVLAYALGKAQRVLAGLDESYGPIAGHGAVLRLNVGYRAAGIDLPTCVALLPENLREIKGRGLIVAPPSVLNTPWIRKLAPYSTAFASGWMAVRGQRRRRGVDRGFPLSDHADWNGLLSAIRETQAETVWVTHGYTFPLVKWLRESGIRSKELKTEFSAESDDASEES
ncbi:MAG: ligase-associated DNA damage response exonuclease [Bdellovibrionota bacterium]